MNFLISVLFYFLFFELAFFVPCSSFCLGNICLKDACFNTAPVQYENLDFDKMDLKKVDFDLMGNVEMSVFYDGLSDSYIKISSKKCLRSESLLKALSLEGYMGISVLKALIVDSDKEFRGIVVPNFMQKQEEKKYDNELFYGFPVIKYESLDFSEMKLTKTATDPKDKSKRSVFYDKVCNTYVKVWSENYTWSKNFERALSFGYYRGLSGLTGVIMDGNKRCRGYVTEAQNAPHIELIKNAYDFLIIKTAEFQNDKYKKLFLKIIANALLFDFYHVDFVKSNIMSDSSSYYIIDLESVLSGDELRDLQKKSPSIFFRMMEHLPVDYRNFIISSI